jgi:hypothetical protein
VRTGVEPPIKEGELAVVHAGMGWEIDQSAYCTVGFTYRVGTTGTHGIAKAAHCWDGWHYAVTLTSDNWGSSYSASNNYESCSTRDYERQTIGNNAGVDYHVYWWGYDSFGVINGVAGGYYIGQLATKVGETSGSLSGTVQGFGNYNRPAGADCPSPGTVHGLWTNINSLPGDSGGPTITPLQPKQLRRLGDIFYESRLGDRWRMDSVLATSIWSSHLCPIESMQLIACTPNASARPG